jgi:poly-gamma-glutamate synthesis protein (capsule biosynthesis protein)
MLVLFLSTSAARAQPADLQFFGDVLINAKTLRHTNSTAANPHLFGGSASLLNSSRHNIINLEGVITTTLAPFEAKQFLLRMPPSAAQILRTAGIDVVTLANNHTMDFGFAGLLSTLTSLARADIASTGAGINQAAASLPLIIKLEHQTICLLAFSKTLPSTFWATTRRAGSAFGAESLVTERISACAARGYFTVVAFHWGKEGEHESLPYQKDLAHLAIEAGADLIIGHHPHNLQEIEVYHDKPIFYSLGNFAFGSEPEAGNQQGMAVQLTFTEDHPREPKVVVIPLSVDNHTVHFVPQLMSRVEADLLQPQITALRSCHWRQTRWSCPFYGQEAL